MWKDNLEMDLRETRWGGMDCIHLAKGRDEWRALVNTVMTDEPSGAIKCWEIFE
jgi:hypothetical protein